MSQLRYQFSCSLGSFTIELNPTAAPKTCAYYEEKFAEPEFADATIFRIVTPANAEMRVNAPIEVIQMGSENLDEANLDEINFETTHVTGLDHIKWTVSAARQGSGTIYPSIFVCMRDEPELNYGGVRHEDGEGFAAFGKVVEGFTALEAIFAKAEAGEFLDNKIPLTTEKL